MVIFSAINLNTLNKLEITSLEQFSWTKLPTCSYFFRCIGQPVFEPLVIGYNTFIYCQYLTTSVPNTYRIFHAFCRNLLLLRFHHMFFFFFFLFFCCIFPEEKWKGRRQRYNVKRKLSRAWRRNVFYHFISQLCFMVGQIVCIINENSTRNQINGCQVSVPSCSLPYYLHLGLSFFFSPPTHTFFLGIVGTV